MTKKLSVALHVHISAEDAARLDGLVVRFPTTKAAVARRALELGMRMLERDPAAFAEQDVLAADQGEEDGGATT